ncbi:MAG: ABC transporter permease subunit [Spirochaetia bacterium]|jgi:NitT/TauT family transport system permease protein
MDEYDKALEQTVPEFEEHAEGARHGALDISATVSAVSIHGWQQVAGIIAVAVVVIGGWEALVRLLHVPQFVFPTPSAIVLALVQDMPTIYPHFFITLSELLSGYVIGGIIGLLLAALLTQVPYFEKIITPYILLLVTTPTIALVPLLMLRMGFTVWPRIVAVALAVGPMVMINSVTGFRRTDLAKIALAKSYGATTFQIFRKIRFPLALPMINVGLLVGGIFGLITAVGSDMVGGKMGLGNKISYYSSLARMDSFFAVILLVSLIGISIWIIMAAIGKKWASWQE